MNDMSRSNMKDLERVLAQALRACLGLPIKTFNIGVISAARVTSLSVFRGQETVRVDLRHISRHPKHHLADGIETRRSPDISVLALLQGGIPNNSEASTSNLSSNDCIRQYESGLMFPES